MSVTTAMIENAHRVGITTFPGNVVSVQHIKSGSTVQGLCTSHRAKAGNDTGGRSEGADITLRVLVRDMGQVAWQDGDQVAWGDPLVTRRITEHGYSPAGQTAGGVFLATVGDYA